MMNGGHQLYLAVVPAGPSSLSPVFCTETRGPMLSCLNCSIIGLGSGGKTTRCFSHSTPGSCTAAAAYQRGVFQKI